MRNSPTHDIQSQLNALNDYISQQHDEKETQALMQLGNEFFSGYTPQELESAEAENLYQALIGCRRFLENKAQSQSNQGWQNKLQKLSGKHWDQYSSAFPTAYREHFSPADAMDDIAVIETLSQSASFGSNFSQLRKTNESTQVFKLYNYGSPLILSDIIPMLENLGMQVIGEQPFQINPNGSQTVWLHYFTVIPNTHNADLNLNPEELASLLQDVITAVWKNLAENDTFNHLVLDTALTWRQVAMLRAYARYIRQTRFGFSQTFIAETLSHNANITQKLAQLFESRFDPNADHDKPNAEELTQDILVNLDQVANRDEDKILRRYLQVINATLRTNFYQTASDSSPKKYFSFKLNPKMIQGLPLPLPKYEIFVYSPRVEGVHLRSGDVARGGIRWSDRIEDYRTEVLGLVKAQQVKNSVIVPMGAKGCFITKDMPEQCSREEAQAEVVERYKTFIRGLLDITDNLIDNNVVHPNAVRCHDGDDPYLVVAADKGTATFSDIANSIANDYQFWLGDAFASGGSQGYDHKKMGITARGAWESAKRHFRERGLNTQLDPFTVTAIGDMSGDVFGNGMLLSEKIQLVAAFNHQHIFLDPEPDASTSFLERKRLFELPRSSWNDYDKNLISKGGGVFSRSDKWIKLSPQVKQRLQIDDDRLVPDDLIQAILKAPVDMLWNGGVGTYIKHSHENDAEVGDKSNDHVRVDGNQLSCHVLVEGGNLGITQRGRIEFAQHGGAINTDFIDNAAGVDCSDHEVNIKILLNEQVALGNISTEERNALLQTMTDEIAELTTANNYRQVQAIATAEKDAADSIDPYIQLIDSMESSGKLNRELEFLPSRETLLKRREQGTGMTRPSLSILIAYVKNELKQSLIQSWVTEDPYLSREMETAFPEQLVKRFPEAVNNHPLYREIAATQIANNLVNHMGITYLYHLNRATGADYSEIAASYLIAREVFDIKTRWEEIENLDYQISVETQEAMMGELTNLLRRASWWLLQHRRKDLNITTCINSYRPGIQQALFSIDQLQQIIPSQDRWLTKFKDFTDAGSPESLSLFTAAAEGLYWLLDIIEAAKELNSDLILVAQLYFQLGEQLELPWLDSQIRTFKAINQWQSLARDSYRDGLDAQQKMLTIQAARDAGPLTEDNTSLETWLQNHDRFISRWKSLLSDMRSTKTIDCATFTTAINVLREAI